MTGVRFAIEGWAAYSAGLHARTQWQEWARAPWRPEGPLAPALEAMPALQRRRLNGLGRAAAQVAWDVHLPHPETPVVFASGYGDAPRCLQLLHAFAATGESSPTDFTFSVHNAIGAMYSIARGDTAASTSVAAGPASAAAGVVEACALLADGAREVLLVCYEAPLPADYTGFQREAASAWAWAWRIVKAKEGAPHLCLAWSAGAAAASRDDLPFGLQALQFALSDARAADLCADGTCWRWSRHV